MVDEELTNALELVSFRVYLAQNCVADMTELGEFLRCAFPDDWAVRDQVRIIDLAMSLLRRFAALRHETPFVRQWVDKRDVLPLQPMECAVTYY